MSAPTVEKTMKDLVEHEVALDDLAADADAAATVAPETADPAGEEAAESEQPGAAESPGRTARLLTSLNWPARLSDKARRIVVGILAALVVAGVGGLGYVWYAADSAAADAAAGQSALSSAKTNIPALLSYDYRSIDTEFPKTAQTLLTGKFLNEYRELGASVIQPAAKKDQIVTKAEVVDAALVSSDKDDATVLLFVNQTTTSRAAAGPRLDGSRIRVQMVKDGGNWKISEFIPV